ncbi:TolC family protein [Candidatus Methylospira mobilis]|uniref:TolC family protein n=1 Tax=Candidatus Methylospira mobilis TaxID=1808979 RepID=UPI0018855391|nr:TolC family protein [Candidatus Methylospira mobilis]WNV03565.1 TolC family protein [Candidatus Methylospira mobilis]
MSPNNGAMEKIGLLQAVRVTLEASPIILAAQQRMEAAAGSLTSAHGQFNTISQASGGVAHNKSSIMYGNTYAATARGLQVTEFDNMFYKLGLSQLFRSGIQVTPTVSTARFTTQDFNNTAPNTSATINLNIVIPLLRGLGVKATAAQEIAAEHGFDKTRYELWQTVADELQKTVSAYWAYVAVAQQLEIWRAAEERNRKLLEDGFRLADADQIPRSDLNNYQASLAGAEADRAQAEQGLVSARQTLGMVMGVPADHLAAIPLPSDSFPVPHTDAVAYATSNLNRMTAYAFGHRSDLLAAEQHMQYYQALLGGAESELKPKVNLSLDIGYTGLSNSVVAMNLLTAYGQNIQGYTGGATLSYEFPFANEKAKGQFRQTASSMTEAQILQGNLARSIASSVQVATSGLQQSMNSLRFASTAVDSRLQAFQSEKKKQLAGMSTVINVMMVEQNLTQAQLAKTQAAMNLANAVVRYRFATASLFAPGDESRDINLERLTTVPLHPDSDMRMP